MGDITEQSRESIDKLDRAIKRMNILLVENIERQDDSKKVKEFIEKYKDYINKPLIEILNEQEYPKQEKLQKDKKDKKNSKNIFKRSDDINKWKTFIRNAIETTIDEKVKDKEKLNKLRTKNSVIDDILSDRDKSKKKGKGFLFLLFTLIQLQFYI